MKKNAILAILAIVSLGFAACGSDGDSTPAGGGGGTTPGATLPEPSYSGKAISVTGITWTSDPADFGRSLPPVKDITLSEDGVIIATVADDAVSEAGKGRTVTPKEAFAKTSSGKARKAFSAPYQYIVGEYTVTSTGAYNIDGVGVITITGAGTSATIAIAFTDADGNFTGTGNISDYPTYSESTETVRNMCRRWRIEGTDVTVTGTNPDYGHFFSAAEGGNGDLYKMVQHLIREKGLNINEDNFKDLGKIDYIQFSRNGRIHIQYSGERTYFGMWKMENDATGLFSWAWDDEDMGNDFINQSGVATFSWYPDRNKALLTLRAKVVADKIYDGTVKFTLVRY